MTNLLVSKINYSFHQANSFSLNLPWSLSSSESFFIFLLTKTEGMLSSESVDSLIPSLEPLRHISPEFLQSSHLHKSEHPMPRLKHSQYFFKQLDFLQLQPFLCTAAILLLLLEVLRSLRLKASGSRSKMLSITSFLIWAWLWLLLHPTQLHCPLHISPAEKHSQ